jgi:hypothetical protein
MAALRVDLLKHLCPDPSTWEQHLILSRYIKDNVHGSQKRSEMVRAAFGYVLTACKKARLLISKYKSSSVSDATQETLGDLLVGFEEVELGYLSLCEYARLGSASPSITVLDRPYVENADCSFPH